MSSDLIFVVYIGHKTKIGEKYCSLGKMHKNVKKQGEPSSASTIANWLKQKRETLIPCRGLKKSKNVFRFFSQSYNINHILYIMYCKIIYCILYNVSKELFILHGHLSSHDISSLKIYSQSSNRQVLPLTQYTYKLTIFLFPISN